MKEIECKHSASHGEIVEKAKTAALTAEGLEEISNMFRMLGEPSRMKIILALLQGEMCVYHIVEACGGQQSAVSHQLRVLKDNKIVKSRRDGQNVLYSLADEHVEELIKIGLTHANCKNG
jgi:ArsR family transcriptional regulator